MPTNTWLRLLIWPLVKALPKQVVGSNTRKSHYFKGILIVLLKRYWIWWIDISTPKRSYRIRLVISLITTTMQYMDLRSEGWVIGSGMVESGGKRFKDRFAQARKNAMEPYRR